MDQFRFCSGILRAFQGVSQDLCGVALFPGTAIDCDDLFHNSMLLLLIPRII